MPVPKKRAARATSLKGIPFPILRRAPSDWPAAHQARWALAYMRGLTGRDADRTDRSHARQVGLRLAYEAGRREAGLELRLVDYARAFSHERVLEEKRESTKEAPRPRFRIFGIPFFRTGGDGWGLTRR